MWQEYIGSEKLKSFSSGYCYKHFRLCSQHFENGMFSSIQKNRLKRNAIPTLFNKPTSPKVQDESLVEDYRQPPISQSPSDMSCFPTSGPSTSSQTVRLPQTEQLEGEFLN
ncbi:uncharacterized protein [Leptinotarsa decemlineata]|uniref:uncharacterized protein n=1 Tax=Leptinotarsa decemlineata TaxID=7539 RepID=UPI003D30AA1F